MNLPYYQIDAFTSRLFSGNPAGVCPLAGWLPDELLQSIAAENNLAETAFFVPGEDGFGLRWFTPEVEMDLCGHATLAAAHVLFRHLAHPEERVRFQTRSGTLEVTRGSGLLTLDFPARPATSCDCPDGLIAGLGRTPVTTSKARDYLATFESEEEIRSLRPEMGILARLDCLGIIATAPGDDCDFVSRFFAPGVGVPEDPVTGSAHCTLIPYWAKRLGRVELHARQLSRRGGELWCEDRGDRVRMGGHAVTYSTGFLHLP